MFERTQCSESSLSSIRLRCVGHSIAVRATVVQDKSTTDSYEPFATKTRSQSVQIPDYIRTYMPKSIIDTVSQPLLLTGMVSGPNGSLRWRLCRWLFLEVVLQLCWAWPQTPILQKDSTNGIPPTILKSGSSVKLMQTFCCPTC